MTDIELLKRLGGIRPAARKLGHRNHTTVQGWFLRQRIPDEKRADVERVAANQSTAA